MNCAEKKQHEAKLKNNIEIYGKILRTLVEGSQLE